MHINYEYCTRQKMLAEETRLGNSHRAKQHFVRYLKKYKSESTMFCLADIIKEPNPLFDLPTKPARLIASFRITRKLKTPNNFDTYKQIVVTSKKPYALRFSMHRTSLLLTVIRVSLCYY
jgi:hypothetical protein